jgi:uncharacterized membrane protein
MDAVNCSSVSILEGTQSSKMRSEAIMLRIGIYYWLLNMVLVALSLTINPSMTLKIAGLVTTNIIGGRMSSILAGYELGIPPLIIILVLFNLNFAWTCLVFPLFIAVHRQVIKHGILFKLIQSAERSAQSVTSSISKMGIIGIPVFIWLPFPWTGALIGSIVGYFTGLSVGKILFLMTISLMAGTISWVYGFRYLFILSGTPGKVGFMILVVILIAAHYIKQKRQQANNVT